MEASTAISIIGIIVTVFVVIVALSDICDGKKENVKELEVLKDKLKKAQSYIVDLENKLKNKSNIWMNK